MNFDYLIVATGAAHSYFGNEHWAEAAPGLKTIEDAIELRRRFLLAFEAAERETDDAARRAQLTFMVIGAGPTGVELAGAMAEIARKRRVVWPDRQAMRDRYGEADVAARLPERCPYGLDQVLGDFWPAERSG